jgi:hypothetical protein
MLMRDPHPDGDADRPVQRADRGESVPFDGKGTTSFQFGKRLQMTPLETGESHVVMTGGVKVLHKALDESTGTLTGDELQAWLKRDGSMEVTRIRAKRDVFIKTPTREIDCNDLDYDLVTGLARLGGGVSIVSGSSRRPYTAEAVVWDVIKDSVRVQGARGDG